jgi:type II secretory pathway pseudopilin PulG
MNDRASEARGGTSGGPGWGLQVVAVVIVAIVAAAALGGGLLVWRVAVGLSGLRCYNNVEELAISLQMYAQDHGRFPPADTWCDKLAAGGYESHPEVFQCSRHRGARSSYAFNDALGEVDPRTIDQREHTVLVFESDGGWNAHGGKEMLVAKPRHNGGDYYGVAGGQMNSANPEALWRSRRPTAGGGSSLRWQPVKRARPRSATTGYDSVAHPATE